jgi:hypothetical protein
VACATGGVELGGGLSVAVVSGQARDQLERGLWDAIALGPLDRVALGGARAPADPDRELVAVRLEGDRDVVDERAEQPLAVLVGGAVRGPQRGQVVRQRLDLLARWLGRWRGLLGELRLGVAEFAELGLPAGLQRAGDEAVLRLAGVERALGADRFIAGPLDA